MRTVPFWLRDKWRAVAVFWLLQGITAYLLLTPLSWFLADTKNLSLIRAGSGLGLTLVFTALQGVFLCPIAKPGAGKRGWPIFASMAVAGLMVALLVAAAFVAGIQVVEMSRDVSDQYMGWYTLALLLVSWAVATALILAFLRPGPRERMLQRIAARLFVGTVIEAAAIIPLDVLVRRRNDCVCAVGTYLALTVCGVVGLFVLGPAVLLPVVARRRKRWYAGRCEICGYDMAGCPAADRCPECGAGWRPRQAAS
jgi:hypothetical protein